MHNLNVIIWSIKSILKNLAKWKYRALLRFVYDSKYRQDVRYMLNVVRMKPVELIDSEVSLGNVISSHEVNYPGWVAHLRLQIVAYGPQHLPPIKVVYDPSKRKYLVVDGNHRLEALKKELPSVQRIRVELLIPKETK